jgi:hypothetical protein
MPERQGDPVTAKLLNISAKDYHANAFSPVPCYSNSIGKIIINQSPRHAWAAHPLLNPEYEAKDSSKFDLGTAAHASLLEGLDICEVCDFPDWRTNDAKAARDAARAAGKIPLLKKDYPALAKMYDAAQEAIHNCADLSGLRLEDGKPEQTIYVVDGDTHIKMRLDWLSDQCDVILDYKSTEVQSPRAWMRTLANSGYDMQGALYSQGVEALTGKPPKFIFLVQETNPPYAAYFVGLSGEYQALGLQKTLVALGLWKDCMRTGFWPPYPPRIMYPDLPPYIEAEWIERQMQHEDDAVGASFSAETFLFGQVR